MAQPSPLDPTSRIESIDVVRGWALLGILVVNIWAFAQPFEAGINPTVLEEYQGPDIFAFFFSWIAFEGSQRAMFSMLFGASIILLTSRLESGDRQAEAKSIYYRRTWWLIGFGLVDIVIFLWYGDILLLYGVVGLILFYARNASPKKLITISVVILALLSIVLYGVGFAVKTFEPIQQVALEKLANDQPLNEMEIAAIEIMKDNPMPKPTPEEFQASVEERANGYLNAFGPNLELSYEAQVLNGLYLLFWDALGMMLLGMALFKLGVFNAELSYRAYFIMLFGGFGVGLSVNALEMINSVAEGYAPTFFAWSYQIGRSATAFGYIALFMLICKANLFAWLRDALAAVGKMALTNYLMQSVICLILFVILGWYGELRFHQFYYVVGAIWLFQIVYSKYWLANYRYGPVEWLWRSLTYKRMVSIR